jgi:hypothetical protein
MSIDTTLLGVRFEPSMVKLAPDAPTATMVALPQGPLVTVEMLVVDAESGEPIPGAEIGWSSRGVSYWMLATGDDGIERMSDTPAETESHGFVRAPGYRMSVARIVPERDGTSLRVPLERGWSNFVRVLAMDGFANVPEIEVLVDGVSVGKTDENGLIRIEGDGPPELIELGAGAPPVLMSPFASPGLDPGDPIVAWTFLVGPH